MRQARITSHVRQAWERTNPMCIVPKKAHTFTGIPAVEVTAAVAKDRIIMWRVADTWNGQEAADMYKDLGAALRRFWGRRRSFRVVEDGDPQGLSIEQGEVRQGRAAHRVLEIATSLARVDATRLLALGRDRAAHA